MTDNVEQHGGSWSETLHSNPTRGPDALPRQTLRSAANIENRQANGTGPLSLSAVSANIQALLRRVRELASPEGCYGVDAALGDCVDVP